MNRQPCCTGDQLRQLLAAEVQSDSSVAEDHVQQCTACQTRLTELAGDESWWETARESLSGDAEPRWEPDEAWTTEFPLSARAATSQLEERQSVQASVEQLLDTPTHPEMLGRLGRYEVESIIGYGGMGAVLKAHDSELNRPVAIKVLAAHLAYVGAARQRFAREGRAAAAVVHDHVVAVHNVEMHDDAPFLVMQYVPGQSLQARVDQQGPLAAEEVLRIGRQAAAGLAAAHAQGLVHRDVKPSNILLENDVDRAILTDFGLARAIDDASLTRTGVIAGTPHYMSPEQACGGPVDPRSDLFSLGAVLYFMCTGRPPFRAANTLAVLHRICNQQHRPVWQAGGDVPDDLSDLIDQLLEKKPNRRLDSAAEVEAELAAILSRRQQRKASRRRFFLWRNKRNRRRLARAVGALGLTSLLAAAIWSQVGNGGDAPAINTDEAGSGVKAADEPSLRSLLDDEQRYATNLDSAATLLLTTDEPTRFASRGETEWDMEVDAMNAALGELEKQDLDTLNQTGDKP